VELAGTTNRGVRPSEVLASRRDEVLAVLDQHGATNVKVFGSIARGEDDENSDVDLLVEMPKGIGLFRRIEIELDLEDLLDRRVDLVSPAEVPTRSRSRVLAEARPL
jgi:predicted nucleotidyltransferase